MSATIHARFSTARPASAAAAASSTPRRAIPAASPLPAMRPGWAASIPMPSSQARSVRTAASTEHMVDTWSTGMDSTTHVGFFDRSNETRETRDPSAAVRVPFMAGNWKTNPATLDQAEALANLVASAARNTAKDKPDTPVEVAVFTPAVYLPTVSQCLDGQPVSLGAQDVYTTDSGAFTGAVSAPMVASVGCEFVLCGHSERRVVFGDDDATTNAKVHKVLEHGMKPVLCVGESKEEYEKGLVRQVCGTQLWEGLRGVTEDDMLGVVIAYEPVWAIGTGLTATPAIAQSVHAFIRSWLLDNYGYKVAAAVRIQYGGSVTPESVDELMACPDVDGCLVGGASLVADKFSRIFNFCPSAGGGITRLWADEAVACGNVLGESPVWSAHDQCLWWVSAVDSELWKWDLRSSARKFDLPDVVGCVALREGGGLVLPLASGIVSYDPATGATYPIVPVFEAGLNTRPNDGRVDRAGNLVVGSYNQAHRTDGADIGGLYLVDPRDHSMREILDYRFRCSNAISFSADNRTMYFTDTPHRRVFAFDYCPMKGLSNRRLFYEMPSALAGGPDGAQVDAQGGVWLALSGAGQVVRLTPQGQVDVVVEVPVSSPTSCTIGGPGLDTLFITTRGPDGGSLYTCQLPDGIKGLPEPAYADPSPLGHLPHGGGSYGAAPGGAAAAGGARFCERCGAGFANAQAQFCGNCGAARP